MSSLPVGWLSSLGWGWRHLAFRLGLLLADDLELKRRSGAQRRLEFACDLPKLIEGIAGAFTMLDRVLAHYAECILEDPFELLFRLEADGVGTSR